MKERIKKLLSNYGLHKLDYVPSFDESKDIYNREILNIVQAYEPTYFEIINGILSLTNEISLLPETCNKDNLEFQWDNGYFPGLDVAALYSLVATLGPSQIIEIGSGYSTMITRIAINQHDIDTSIVSIDPEPRAFIDSISDQVFRKSLVETDVDIFRNLKSGDFLFLDGSHRLLPDSDVGHFFINVLPVVPAGVYIHIHDVYLPYDYPMFMKERLYSEQYALAIALIHGSQDYEITFPCYYISEQPHLHKTLEGLWESISYSGIEKHGGSFWMRKK